MPKQREKMTEVHSCGSPPFSTCLGAVASFIISQGQKCHKKPFPLVYHQSHKEKSVKGGHRPQRLPLILFFVVYETSFPYDKNAPRECAKAHSFFHDNRMLAERAFYCWKAAQTMTDFPEI